MDRKRLRWVILIVAGLTAALAATWLAGRIAAVRARQEIARTANVAAQLHAAVLRSELEKHGSLPFVLAEDVELQQALIHGDAARLQRLNVKLEGLSERTRTAVIYVLNQDGRAVAASNWRMPTSFVGIDYGFRPYYANAMRDGAADYFALGAVSGRPGLFLARRVSNASGVLGVIVVKVEFNALESEWARSGEPAFVVNENGVVLITNVAAWRFGVIGPMTPERRRLLAEERQMPESALHTLPLGREPPDRDIPVRLPGADQAARFIEARIATASPGWTLYLLKATDPYLPNSVATARTLTFSASLLAMLVLAIILYRRQRAERQHAAREAARAELEARVSERTAELRAANGRLVIEMDERQRAEANLHQLRDELVQASKLAVLGQIAAGVAHEINQPIAAIRAYSDNARILLERGKGETAHENLSKIAAMTERVGMITDELRAFSRKSTGAPEAIEVEGPIAGAILLLAPRAKRQRVSWTREGATEGLKVMATHARLEQVLVNLLQNALEAVEGVKKPVIRIKVEASADAVRITVADNGAGAPEALRAQLFTPFVTTKKNGLGLGLVISRDIVATFGGELILADSDAGAEFIVILKRAI